MSAVIKFNSRTYRIKNWLLADIPLRHGKDSMNSLNSRQKTLIEKLLESLENKPEYVKLFIFPITVFSFDFFMRVFIGVDLIDAGADMALVAATLFLSAIIEDSEESTTKPYVLVPLFLLFLLPWMFCLWGVSEHSNVVVKFLNLEFNMRPVFTVLSWLVGITTLIVSGAFAYYVVPRNRTTS